MAKRKTSKKAAAKTVRKEAPKAAKRTFPADIYQFSAFKGVQTPQAMEKMMTQGKTKLDRLAQEASCVGKDHMDACLKSSNIFMKGFEDIMETYMGMTQELTERNSEAFKEMLSCKTLNQLTETQTRLAQESFDELMSGATRLSELGVRVATDAFEPINDQLSKSVRKATESMAA